MVCKRSGIPSPLASVASFLAEFDVDELDVDDEEVEDDEDEVEDKLEVDEVDDVEDDDVCPLAWTGAADAAGVGCEIAGCVNFAVRSSFSEDREARLPLAMAVPTRPPAWSPTNRPQVISSASANMAAHPTQSR